MRIDVTSMFFNSKIEGQTATPAWGTSIGQNKSRHCRIDDFKKEVVEMVIGMTYKSIADLSNLDVSKGSDNRDIVTCSVFKDVYINNKKIENAQYVLLLVREHSKSHDGRLLISYAPYIKYNGIQNQSCIDLMQQELGCTPEGCWFVYDISIKNQSELYFSAVVVNATAPMVYSNIKSKNRSEEWKALIPADGVADSFSKTALSDPLQQIFYGAPGTGKSNTIKSKVDVKKLPCIRTTFHPDSDYSTFVGAYKPVMEECDVKVTPIVTNNGVSLQPSGTYKERRITYKFVKQAFLKAYLGAWKKYVDGGSSSSQRQGLSLPATNGDYFILVEVGKDYVGHTKESRIKVSQFETAVKDYWKKNLIPNNPDKWKWYESLVCDWYYDPEDEQTAEGCWDAFKKELNDNNNTFRCEKRNQIYLMKLDGDDITISTIIVKKAWKRAIQNVYDSNDLQGYSIQATIAQKLQEYGGTFEEAWEKLKKEVEASKSSSANTSDSNAVLPQFLIIEEINRGNCAQIFGDLFQLLDRGENGFSEYPIEADTDLQQEIARAFKEEDEYKLSSNIDIEGEVNCYKSNYGKTLSEDVQEGRVLLLPPNLYIWATMNTSDQSLFPIDSAFKRRWDWEYMPIGYKNEDWKIEIGEKEYEWVAFQREINDRIYSIDNSEDKQLGDYFVNANLTDKKISSDVLLNKILFYLWNDVCKDDPEQIFRWKDDKDNNQEKSIKFSEFFCEKAEKERKLQGFMAFLGIKAVGGAGEKVEQKDEATAGNDDVVNS